MGNPADGHKLIRPKDGRIHESVHQLFDVPGNILHGDSEEALNLILRYYRLVSGIPQTLDGMTLFFLLADSKLRRMTAPVLLMAGEYAQLCVPRDVHRRGKRTPLKLEKAEIVPEAG
jgi:hypothetical protein